ncbi:MAG: hypothetical protein ABSA02_00725 [Trebonia sp.]
MNASEKRYTDSWPKFVGWTLGRALLHCAAASSGLGGSALPSCTAIHAVDEGFPPLTWWRAGARAGVGAAEAFANNGAQAPGNPGPARTRERPANGYGRRRLGG